MISDAERISLPAGPDAAAQRRDELFRETPIETLERWVLGAAWALKPERIGAVPALARLWASDLVSPRSGLPNAAEAAEDHDGLCGIVHDTSVATLLQAYRQGLYTFAHFGPLKWFSPPQRCVLFFDEMHVGKTTRRHLRQQRYRVTFDRDFARVIKSCAGRRDGKWHVTWITPRIMRIYADLHDAGHVHSFEVWNSEGALVGGGYGVAVGRVFFTESQFSLERDTSKIGFTVLNWHLAQWGFALNDGKGPTPTILDMGFRSIPRSEFLDHLERATAVPGKSGMWQVEADLSTVAAWQAAQPQREREVEPQGA
jgi:leucyl/phenylalanyl-tRNA--protein transferase